MTNDLKGTVLVTGASGFVGSHIVTLLLEAGYSVRATARGDKVVALKKAFEGKAIEVIEIKDIAKDDLSGAFKGLSAIIHSASPLAGKTSAEDTLRATVEGTLNVMRSALKAEISKVIVTSTWATALDRELAFFYSLSPKLTGAKADLRQTYEGKVFDQNSWGEVRAESIVDGTRNPLYVYLGSKIVAEKAAWKLAEENPMLDLTTINPPFIYGPFIDGLFPTSPENAGTNAFIIGLISGPPGRPLPPLLSPYYIDVRDVARAHVAALEVPKVTSGNLVQKRFLISGGTLTWKDAVDYIAEARTELKTRLPSPNVAATLPANVSKNDVTPAERNLGLSEYIEWKKTIIDTVDNLLVLEKKWQEA